MLAAVLLIFNRVTGIILPVILHPLPQRVSGVVTVMGAPVHFPHTEGAEPSEEQAQEAMDKYVREVEKLYQTHAHIYNSNKARPLVIT